MAQLPRQPYTALGPRERLSAGSGFEMSEIKRLASLVARALITILAMLQTPASASAHPRLVFASYMTCCPMLGNDQTVEDYKREIQQAQAAGIDGFALDISYWPRVRRSSTNVDRLFDAADQSDFKLFIMADQGNPTGGLSPDQFLDLLTRFDHRRSYYRYEGKAFLSTYLGEADWISKIRRRAREAGHPIYLVPYLGLRKTSALNAFGENPQLSIMIPRLADIDGYFSFLVYGTAAHQRDVMEKLSRALKESGKTYMAGLPPYYRRATPKLWVDDGEGVEKIVSGLAAANDVDANWVQIVTWNDWTESTYLQPFQTDEVTSGTGRWKGLLNHGPILSFLAPFIRAYKTGAMEPVTQDRAILMYRPALKQALCDADTADVRRQGKRDRWLEALSDRVYLAVLLARPAVLNVSVGGKAFRFSVGSGYSQVSVPAIAGTVSASMMQNGKTVLSSRNAKSISRTRMSSCFNIYATELQP